ncbi:GntR family transcriptional regulator [Bordetella genomosp. 10]|uniref:GntR family transcriptional regulator n=1 Tax=Bordetella genomosp. 10 TaxID=1416804 RepID=A0A261S0X0_9BORD|nr:FadR/GntR family transcriptional regulator [Bordetella genomosp. 10]OZI30996.1 GntR family transcriptional regulator [Bordetella genomosp. 10]
MISFSAVQPGLKLADRVAQQLEAEIRAGHFKPGAKLPTEAVLVQQLAVSRTVVREALSRLKSRNLIESRQGSGVYVRPASVEPLNFDDLPSASRDAVIQIVEVRRALESEVAELAALRRSDEDLRRIRQAVDDLAQAVREGRDGVEEDVAFHRAIGQAAGNPFLISTLDYLAQFLRSATRVTRANEARRADFAQAVTEEHDRVVQAIAAGDAKAARQAAADHMNNAIVRIQQADAGFWRQDGERLAQAILPPTP